MRIVLAVLLPAVALSSESLKPKTIEAWNAYVKQTEDRWERESTDAEAMRQATVSGQIQIQRVDTGKVRLESALIHDWRGGVWIPGARMKPLLEWVQNYDAHSKYFTEVERSKLRSRDGDTFKIYYRFRRKKIITVYYNTEHTVVYQVMDATHARSRSVATRIAELDDPGTAKEKEKPEGRDNGFLWRLNSYWRFLETPDGVFLECESISLSRGIPAGLAWAAKGFVESVPRESLESTLSSIRKGFTGQE